MDYAIGIDLGGSSIKSVAVTTDGAVLAREHRTFRPEAEMDWAESIRAIVRQIQSSQGAAASHIGLSAPGLAAANGRAIAYMPGRLQGLAGLDWTEFLATPRPVKVLNDAQAALLGEAWLGAAHGFRNVIMLTLGTGVGGASIVDGHLLGGHIGRAGHLGHTCLDPNGPPDVCGTPGSLEVCIGNCTVESRSGGRFQSTHDLVAAYLAGDTQAGAVWLKSVRELACALATFANVLDPEAAIIGGGIAKSEEALFKPLRQFMAEVEWRPGGHAIKIVAATLGEFAGAFGAAFNAALR